VFSHFPLHQKNLFTLLFRLCTPAQRRVPGGAEAAFAGDRDLALTTGVRQLLLEPLTFLSPAHFDTSPLIF